MQVALENEIRSIAFPSISTGVYSFPVELAAKIAVKTVSRFLEDKFDTEAMLNMLQKKVLEPAGGDYSSIKIRYMAKGQEAAKNIEHVPKQDALEHEEQEQHAPVQTM